MSTSSFLSLLSTTTVLTVFGALAPRDAQADNGNAPIIRGLAGASEGPTERRDPADESPTVGGLSGLIRLVTGDIGKQHTFRLSLHTQTFTASEFLVEQDQNTRFIGTLSASYTPWRYIELFLSIKSQANSNERPPETQRLDDEVILALGDVDFGGKFVYPVHPAFAIGGNLALALLNSAGGVFFDGSATSFYAGALASLDIAKLGSSIPLRFHTNVGFLLDNSENLADFGSNYTRASLHVEKFALGINRSRMQFKLGVDAQLRKWTVIGLSPIVEFAVDVATGEEDRDFAVRAVTAQDRDELGGRITSWLTFGARANPVRGLAIDLATDIGLASPGFGFGPPVVPWNFIFGVSYAYDPQPPTQFVTRERTKTIVKRIGEGGAPKGQVQGRVVDATTLAPISGAVITFPGKDLTGLSSDPDGGFQSYRFPSGQVTMVVRHPKYQAAKAIAKVEADATTDVEVRLKPAEPDHAKLSARVLSVGGSPIEDATVSIEGEPGHQRATSDALGAFSVRLAPGTYQLTISAGGYLSKTQPLTVRAGEITSTSFTLLAASQEPIAKLVHRRIIIRRRVHFAAGTAEIRPNSQEILDAVAEVLRQNKQVTKVEIQGHTDSSGTEAGNLKLSNERAAAVLQYLTSVGIEADRLVAKGYGQSRPRRPNLSAKNRAFNRRVEFRILEIAPEEKQAAEPGLKKLGHTR